MNRAGGALAAAVAFASIVGCSARFSPADSRESSSETPPAGATESAAPDQVEWLVGEVNLHQFPAGSDLWAAFLDPAPAIAEIQGESITEIDTQATGVEGPCTVFVLPLCDPSCAAGQYCWSNDSCKPFPRWTPVDAGAFVVTGSRELSLVRFAFDASAGGYVSDPAVGSNVQLFAGGEPLTLAGGEGDWSASTEVPAPMPVVLDEPSPQAPLHFPASGPMDLRWESAGADEMDVYLSVATNDAPGVQVRCVIGDTGAFTVPADIVARFPPPPRQIRIELQRTEQRIARAARPGYGLLFHVAFSAWLDGAD
jgi:hypothetical protein